MTRQERTERAALVVLLRAGKRAWRAYADRIEAGCSAAELLEEERGANLCAPRLFTDDSHDPESALASAAAELDEWERQGMRLISLLDSDYPENLRGIHDRPPFLFVAGELDQRDARAVAVVGSRAATSEGIASARSIAQHLVEHGYTVVSGLATGIDTAAHTAALGGGRTVAVIGSGLEHRYPPENAALTRRIASAGAVVSQFWPDAPPSRRGLRARNAVVSGLSLAAVIVEASYRSGARILARRSLAQGRPVFLCPALLDQEWARTLAARPGTYSVRSPEEVTATLERLTAGALTA